MENKELINAFNEIFPNSPISSVEELDAIDSVLLAQSLSLYLEFSGYSTEEISPVALLVQYRGLRGQLKPVTSPIDFSNAVSVLDAILSSGALKEGFP